MEHYLDNSATTKVCPEAAAAALKAMTEVYGNPSSTHTVGREAKKLLDQSRRQVAAALGCKEQELVFTSCGSESDNWAVLGGAEAMKRKGRHVISSAVEHDAVRRSLDELENRGWICVRPSGTEPKIKLYVNAVSGSAADTTAMLEKLSSAAVKLLESKI